MLVEVRRWELCLEPQRSDSDVSSCLCRLFWHQFSLSTVGLKTSGLHIHSMSKRLLVRFLPKTQILFSLQTRLLKKSRLVETILSLNYCFHRLNVPAKRSLQPANRPARAWQEAISVCSTGGCTLFSAGQEIVPTLNQVHVCKPANQI